MNGTAHRADVLVLGGGIIGLAIAWRAAGLGLSVSVLERDLTGQGASHVAAGMLAPVAEAEFGSAGRRVLDLGLRSAGIWPAFAAELQEAAGGTPIGLRNTGTLLVACDGDEAAELERQIAFRDSLGLSVERLRPSAAREREPALAPTVRLALEAREDRSVDPRPVLAALRRACLSAGVLVRENSPVAALEVGGSPDRVTAVTLKSGERLQGAHVVMAAGAWVGRIDGLPPAAR